MAVMSHVHVPWFITSLLVSVSISCSCSHNMSDTDDGNFTIKLGWIGYLRNSGDADSLASFLGACTYINENALDVFGNESFRVQPYVGTPESDVGSVQVVRSAEMLMADPTSYKLSNNLSAKNVDIVISGTTNVDAPRVASTAELNGKIALEFKALGNEISDKTLYPNSFRMIAPLKYEVSSLVRSAFHFGWTRIGIIYDSGIYGTFVKQRFEKITDALNVSRGAESVIISGIDHTTENGRDSVTRMAKSLRKSFLEANVKVYLFAVDVPDVYTALSVVNESGVIGSGFIPLVFGSVLGVTRYSKDPGLMNLLAGSLGLSPKYDESSEQYQHMMQSMPNSKNEWEYLLKNIPGAPNKDDTPSPHYNVDERFSVYSYYSWDATLYASMFLKENWDACASSGRPRFNPMCLMDIDRIRGVSLTGSTGKIRFSNTLDRSGAFSIVNVVSATQIVNVGSFFWNGVANVDVDINKIVWSDNSTNRSSAPMWGQEPLITSAPTPDATAAATHTDDASDTLVAIISVLGGILFFFILLVIGNRLQAKLEKRRPRDFKKIISALQEQVDNNLTLIALGESYNDNDSNSKESDHLLEESKLISIVAPSELKRSSVMLRKVIGQGQFGKVFSGAWTTKVGRVATAVPVAVKTIFLSDEDDETLSSQHRDAFLAEAAVTWQMEHTNIIQMFGVVTAGVPFFMVLELCEKGSVLNIVRREKQTEQRLVSFLNGIAHGMAYLISRRFVHRDLACRNVLVSRDDTAKICDFGLGRIHKVQDYYRMTKLVPLPLRWTDPWVIDEMVFCESTDVWSFGITAIEMFTSGRHPYGSWSDTKVIDSVKAGYRLPNPPTMPKALYDEVVFPCWQINDACDAEPDFVKMDNLKLNHVPKMQARQWKKFFERYKGRPTFAELCNRLDRLTKCDLVPDSTTHTDIPETIDNSRDTGLTGLDRTKDDLRPYLVSSAVSANVYSGLHTSDTQIGDDYLSSASTPELVVNLAEVSEGQALLHAGTPEKVYELEKETSTFFDDKTVKPYSVVPLPYSSVPLPYNISFVPESPSCTDELHSEREFDPKSAGFNVYGPVPDSDANVSHYRMECISAVEGTVVNSDRRKDIDHFDNGLGVSSTVV